MQVYMQIAKFCKNIHFIMQSFQCCPILTWVTRFECVKERNAEHEKLPISNFDQ